MRSVRCRSFNILISPPPIPPCCHSPRTPTHTSTTPNYSTRERESAREQASTRVTYVRHEALLLVKSKVPANPHHTKARVLDVQVGVVRRHVQRLEGMGDQLLFGRVGEALEVLLKVCLRRLCPRTDRLREWGGGGGGGEAGGGVETRGAIAVCVFVCVQGIVDDGV